MRGEPRTGRPTGCPTKAGPTARWDAVCMSIWIYACADITLNLRRVQISPSICVVADDEDDRDHLSPSRVSAAVAGCRAASGDYPKDSTENPPMCLSKVSETDKWRLVQPERLRRLRLWASPVRMFEVAEEGCRRGPPQRLDPRMSSEKSPRAMLLRACLS